MNKTSFIQNPTLDDIIATHSEATKISESL